MFKFGFVLLLGFVVGAIAIDNKQYFNKTVATPIAFFPDGGVYEGALLKGELNGTGRIVWPDGSYYEGEFKRGLYHGQGILNTKEYTYEGEFDNGLAKGKGLIEFDDGRIYEGEVDFGKANGEGIMRIDSDEYIGNFKDNLYSGEGKITKENGSAYEGQFQDGEFHGDGLFTSADGQIFKGQFIKGALTGSGDYRDAETSYTGLFKNWLFHGYGEFKDSTQRYEGDFISGQYSGKGQYTNKDGTVYTGDFLSGMYHGQGLLVKPGESYEGGFEYGEKHGEGELTYSEPLDGIAKVTGVWRYGKLMSSDNPLVEHDEHIISEAMLYSQVDQLNNAISKVKDNDPETTELYFFGVAGDGKEGVFRRELNFVRDSFDEAYGTQNKSLILINGNVSYKDTPLATVTSIELALNAIANKMDPENDILFAFFTSHGSDDFHFSLDQQGLRLPSLSAEKMGDIFNSLPIRHKVIVISACYSGGFIDAVKDESTMVITAASPDKASFGCSDTASMTYFGEAFFKDALPQSNSFVEAFDRSRDIVKGREAKEDFPHSKPLIFKPESIRQQLLVWREALAAWKEEQNKLID